MEHLNFFVVFEKVWQAFCENGVALVFVEFRHYDRLRKLDAGFLVRLADEARSFHLSNAGANTDATKNQFSLSPVFTKLASLNFADGRKPVIVRLKERSLPVPREKNSAHDNFCALCTSALLFLEIGERLSLPGELFQ